MIFAFGPFEVDDLLFELRREGVPLPVQRKTLDVLLFLIRMRGSVVTREELTREVWAGVVVSEAAVTQAILTVRKALSDDGTDPKIIKTARGRGYRFVMEVTEVASSSPSYEIASSPAGRPLPEKMPFVGRAGALACLEEAARDARGGRGRMVLVVGQQGIGKTRLVEELVQRTTGHRVVKAHGYAGEGAPPLWPWLQIERRIEERADTAETEALADPAARFRYGDRLARRLLELSRKEPLLLVIEDAHWVDPASLELLLLLTPELTDARMMIVLTTRGTPAGALGAIARLPTVSTVELAPLGRPEIEELVQALTGRTPNPAVVARCLEKTGGIPSLFVQIAHVLVPDGARAPGTSAMLGTAAVKEAVAQQVASLSRDVRDVLTVAAVMGGTFTLGPLALALETTPDAAMRLLDEAIGAHIVSSGGEPGTYRFTQPLVRDALFRRLPEGERACLHGRVGNAFIAFLGPEGAASRAAEIAPHLVEMAVLGEIEAAVRFSLLAHAQARAHGDAHASARFIDLARRALQCGRASPETDALRAFVERSETKPTGEPEGAESAEPSRST